MPTPTQFQRPLSRLLDLLFPPRCIGCQKVGSLLCPVCQDSLPRLPPPYCERCGAPQQREGLCPNCRQTPSPLEGIRSLLLMEGTAREAIHQLKYHNLKSLAPLLAHLLVDYLRQNPIPAELVVPVPLHRSRLRERGYNQAALLARGLSQELGLPLVEGVLLRSRPTAPQARIASAEERRGNVADAFTCSPAHPSGKQVLLVDDVCTTGATLEACAQALKRAGAGPIWGITLAREA